MVQLADTASLARAWNTKPLRFSPTKVVASALTLKDSHACFSHRRSEHAISICDLFVCEYDFSVSDNHSLHF